MRKIQSTTAKSPRFYFLLIYSARHSRNGIPSSYLSCMRRSKHSADGFGLTDPRSAKGNKNICRSFQLALSSMSTVNQTQMSKDVESSRGTRAWRETSHSSRRTLDGDYLG